MAETSIQTTQARSIVTLDGYVSRGRSPPPSVPRDHKMLQEFAAYLELRLKSQNLSILRRIFADFLNEQENTLVPMMQQGCTIITVFSVLRTSTQRRQQAEFLLQKPKFPLDSRGCVFFFLQYRTATRNMTLLKHLFLDFVGRRETVLMDFVKRGCQVISVIPFKLPQIVSESPQAEEQETSSVAVVKKIKKGRKEKKVSSRSGSLASKSADKVQVAQKRGRGRLCHVLETAATMVDDEAQQDVGTPKGPGNDTEKGAAARKEPGGDAAFVLLEKIATSGELELKKRCKRTSAVSVSVSGASKETDTDTAPSSNSAVVAAPKRGRKPKTRTASGASEENVVTTTVTRAEAPEVSATATAKPSQASVSTTVTRAEAIEGSDTATAKKPQAFLAATVTKAEALLEKTATSGEPELGTKKRSKHTSAASVSVSGANKETDTEAAPSSRSAVVAAPKRDRKPKSRTASSESEQNDVTTAVTQAEAPEVSATATAKKPQASLAATVKKAEPRLAEAAATAIAKQAEAFLAKAAAVATTAKQADDSLVEDDVATTAKQAENALAKAAVPTIAKQVKAPLAQVSVPATEEQAEANQTESEGPPKTKRGRKRKAATDAPIQEKARKRGKPAMSDEMCRSQLELAQRMEPFEAQIPWEVVYANLPAPFDELKHPELSAKYRKFWRKHARAVWERNFWVPLSRKKNLLEFNTRNNRQLKAKNGFELIIVSAYQELGAAFFIMLDSQKHPGWWYRGPVVALFALQQIKSEEVVWDYVKNEALERFPNCKLPLPLKAPNSAAVLKCHTRDSESMWMANHPEAPEILNAIAQFKAKLQTEITEGEQQSVML